MSTTCRPAVDQLSPGGATSEGPLDIHARHRRPWSAAHSSTQCQPQFAHPLHKCRPMYTTACDQAPATSSSAVLRNHVKSTGITKSRMRSKGAGELIDFRTARFPDSYRSALRITRTRMLLRRCGSLHTRVKAADTVDPFSVTPPASSAAAAAVSRCRCRCHSWCCCCCCCCCR